MAQLAMVEQEPWMCHLRPSRATPLQPSAAPDVLSTAMAELGLGPVAWAVESARLLLAEQRRRTTGFGPGPTSSRGLETELLSLLLQLRGSATVGAFRVHRLRLDDARMLARSGAPVVAVTESVWRLRGHVQESMLPLTTVTRGDSTAFDRVRTDLCRLTEYSEVAVRAMTTAYEEESAAWWDRRSSRRRAVIERLVAGQPFTSSEDEELLGVSRGGSHLVAIVTDETSGVAVPVDDPRLGQLARAVASWISRCSLVSSVIGTDTVLWWSRTRTIGRAELDGLREVVVPPGLAVAFGEPHSTPDAVARSFGQARRARTVARTSHRREPWLHRDVLLSSVLLSDPAATRDLVTRELAGVLGRDRRSVELRQTVLTYLRSGGSRQSVAQELGVAATTVGQRIRRFERLRGRQLHDATLETWTALDIVDLVPSVLDGCVEPPDPTA